MRKFKIFGIGIILFFGCKEKIDDFLFDSAKTHQIVKYSYAYKHGQKYSNSETNYVILFGNIADSVVSITTYDYNSKGQLVKEIINTHKGLPDIRTLIYNENDSLILEHIVNSDGDTTFIEKYAYFPDGKKSIYNRFIYLNFNPSVSIESAKRHRTYDTITSSSEYIYENNICKSENKFDKNKKLTSVVEFEYSDNKICKELHYSIFNNLKMLEKIKHLDYTKNNLLPDYFSVDPKNDTIEFKKTEYRDNEIANSLESFEKGNNKIKRFYKDKKKIGEMWIDKKLNFKANYSYTYFENGELEEEKSYREKLNAH